MQETVSVNRLFFEPIFELLADLVEFRWDVERAVRLVRVALVVVLVFGLGLVEAGQRLDLGDDLVVVDALIFEFLDKRLGFFLLGVGVGKDRRPVLAADIRSLAVELGRIVDRKQDFKQVSVADLVGIVLDLDDFGVAGLGSSDRPCPRQRSRR